MQRKVSDFIIIFNRRNHLFHQSNLFDLFSPIQSFNISCFARSVQNYFFRHSGLIFHDKSMFVTTHEIEKECYSFGFF